MYCNKTENCRYVLKSLNSKRPLFVIGANPSIADDTRDDPTVKNIKKIAENNGFDGVIIINVFPLICTDPEKLPEAGNEEIHLKNQEFIKNEITEFQKNFPEESLNVWCAWGNLVEKRNYLENYAKDIVDLFPAGTNFLCLEKTKSGHPAHPLYHKVTSKLVQYDGSETTNMLK